MTKKTEENRKNVIAIEGGTHLMVITKGREIARIIREKLED